MDKKNMESGKINNLCGGGSHMIIGRDFYNVKKRVIEIIREGKGLFIKEYEINADYSSYEDQPRDIDDDYLDYIGEEMRSLK